MVRKYARRDLPRDDVRFVRGSDADYEQARAALKDDIAARVADAPPAPTFCQGAEIDGDCLCPRACFCNHDYHNNAPCLYCDCTDFEETCLVCGIGVDEYGTHLCPDGFLEENARYFEFLPETEDEKMAHDFEVQEPSYLGLPLTSAALDDRLTAGTRYFVSCCGDFIQSLNRHDYVVCRCKRSAVDGGSAYDLRITQDTVAATFVPTTRRGI